MQELDAFLDKITYLPPFPQNVPQLLELLSNPDVDSEQVVSLISYDPSLTTNVMRLCNSAFFGVSNPVNTLEEAVFRLGFDEVYQLVVAVSSAKTLAPAQKGYGIDAGELWTHSIVTAIAAKLLAKDNGDDANAIFTAAILHDIGKVALAQVLENSYTKLIEDVEKNQHSLLEAEKALFGIQHAEVGGRLLARWKFSAQLVTAVWSHHDPVKAVPYQKHAAYVYLGNMIAYFMGHGYGHLAFAMRGRSEALEILGLSPSVLPGYMIRTFESMESLQSLINIKT